LFVPFESFILIESPNYNRIFVLVKRKNMFKI